MSSIICVRVGCVFFFSVSGEQHEIQDCVTNGERKNGEGTKTRSFLPFSPHPSPHFSLAVFRPALQ